LKRGKKSTLTSLPFRSESRCVECVWKIAIHTLTVFVLDMAHCVYSLDFFCSQVKESNAPGYFKKVTQPMDLNQIKTDITNGVRSAYQCLPVLTSAYQCLPVLTSAYQCLPVLTSAYQCLPVLTSAYQCLPVLIHLSHQRSYTSHTPLTSVLIHLSYTSHTSAHTPLIHLSHQSSHTSHTPLTPALTPVLTHLSCCHLHSPCVRHDATDVAFVRATGRWELCIS
jgi:hypothetical protein